MSYSQIQGTYDNGISYFKEIGWEYESIAGKQEIMEIHQATDVKNKIELLKTKIQTHTHIYFKI